MNASAVPRLSDDFIIVLNEPQDIVNIAGTVRAMMNTGFRRLRLVRPALFDAYRIAGIAHGSEALLESVEFFDSLQDALVDSGRVVGTTSRRRTATYVWQHPRAAAPQLLESAAVSGPVAIVFGREDRGLSNEALDLCDLLLVVPTDPAHPSLNLAQAVLLITYELWLAALDQVTLPHPKRRATPARPAELNELFRDAGTALDTIEFFKARNAPMVMRTLRAILRRAHLNAREAALLRAMAIEVRKFFERKFAEQKSGGRAALPAHDAEELTE